jgi:hypothetical protein
LCLSYVLRVKSLELTVKSSELGVKSQ